MKAGRAEKARLYKGTFHTPVLRNISKACPSFAKAHKVRLYRQPVFQHDNHELNHQITGARNKRVFLH